MTSIRIEGAAELIARINTISGMMRVKSAIAAAAMDLKGYITAYPTNHKGPNPMLSGPGDKSKRMRAGFFYHLNAGNISVPYKRGGKLGQSWNVRSINAGWGRVIGTSMSYAKLVQGNDAQTFYHKKSGWPTPDSVVEEHSAAAIALIRQALVDEVNG